MIRYEIYLLGVAAEIEKEETGLNNLKSIFRFRLHIALTLSNYPKYNYRVFKNDS